MTYKPTALERRHPRIMARKRHEATTALKDERYRNAQCTRCGYSLDDFSLVVGYEMCGECEQA